MAFLLFGFETGRDDRSARVARANLDTVKIGADLDTVNMKVDIAQIDPHIGRGSGRPGALSRGDEQTNRVPPRRSPPHAPEGQPGAHRRVGDRRAQPARGGAQGRGQPQRPLSSLQGSRQPAGRAGRGRLRRARPGDGRRARRRARRARPPRGVRTGVHPLCAQVAGTLQVDVPARADRPDAEAAASAPSSTLALETLTAAIIEAQAGGLAPAGDPKPLVLTCWAAVHGLASLFLDGPLARAHRAFAASPDKLTAVVPATLSALMIGSGRRAPKAKGK